MKKLNFPLIFVDMMFVGDYMLKFWTGFFLLKFIYSEKATKFCEIFTLLLTVCTVVKSKVKILQNFEAFSEYMNFTLESES